MIQITDDELWAIKAHLAGILGIVNALEKECDPDDFYEITVKIGRLAMKAQITVVGVIQRARFEHVSDHTDHRD